MAVSSLFSQSTNPLASSATTDLTSLTLDTTDASTNTVTSSSTDSTNISKPGQLYKELEELAQTDPTKFKQVTAQIAAQLKSAASNATGTTANFLNQLAAKFQSASTTGSAAGLAPHHHHHGGGSSSSTAGSITANPLTNNGTSSSSSSISAAFQSAISAYSSQSSIPADQIDSIIESALSGTTSTNS